MHDPHILPITLKQGVFIMLFFLGLCAAAAILNLCVFTLGA